MASTNSHSPQGAPLHLLTLGALGVVYGDIGTSPLYALRECFDPDRHVRPDADNVLGILSLVVWALILLVSFKYMLLALRADSRGEGGILTLLSLVLSISKDRDPKTKQRVGAIALGLLGAALLCGDAAITPSMTVLSAVEGLRVVEPSLERWVVPISVVILLSLFLVQQRGTGSIGGAFGPIILVWFGVIGTYGLLSTVQSPEILGAVNPLRAISFVAQHGVMTFYVLTGVILVITGSEAVYSDLGHFGKTPIRIGWFGVALPALLLNYFGQGAAILRDPARAEDPFYAIVPQSLALPTVILATAAAVIASQAVITGLFSLTHQASLLDYLPRLRVIHTSAVKRGQIYVPTVNWLLMAAAVGLVIGFGSSSRLAGAYGVANATTMLFTSILLSQVARHLWNWRIPPLLLVFAVLISVDAGLFSSALLKIVDGGWFPLATASMIYIMFITWRRGRELLRRRTSMDQMPLEYFVENVTKGAHAVKRVPGTAVFLNRNTTGTPRALGHNIKCNKVLHETVIVFSILVEEAPHVPEDQRIEVKSLGNGLYRIVARYGFMESPNVIDVLRRCGTHGLTIDTFAVTFFVGREVIVSTEKAGMARWREHLFAFLTRNAAAPTTFFNVPPNQTVEFGLQVEM